MTNAWPSPLFRKNTPDQKPRADCASHSSRGVRRLPEDPSQHQETQPPPLPLCCCKHKWLIRSFVLRNTVFLLMGLKKSAFTQESQFQTFQLDLLKKTANVNTIAPSIGLSTFGIKRKKKKTTDRTLC